jgi:hypothetical protein
VVSQAAGAAGGTDEEQDQHAVDGSRGELPHNRFSGKPETIRSSTA